MKEFEGFQEIKWFEPVNLASKIANSFASKNFAFLYSALHRDQANSHSYLAIFPQKKIILEDFSKLESTIQKELKSSEKNDEESDIKASQTWFGYVAYEASEDLENLPKNPPSFIALPKILLTNFAVIFDFDHDSQRLTCNYSNKNLLAEALAIIESDTKFDFTEETAKNFVKEISSNFSDEDYLQIIDEIRARIAAGELFQTNLTRKFFGEFNQKISTEIAFKLFTQLCELSPANYSSFFSFDENLIISASPELFLKASNQKIISRPIKGTARRGKTADEDVKIKEDLQNSAKERAENLMIVDLMRNDFSRFCRVKSVKVENLFAATTYKNLHHLSSEIHGIIADENNAINALTACFPPGSMTGAPKIKAIEVASNYEKMARGVYSGCIGMICGLDELNLAVVIRTLIISGKKFEFQAGGAITYESSAANELQEIYTKMTAIKNLLQL